MDIINISGAYPNAHFAALVPALLEHEGHHLTVRRNAGGGKGISPELRLVCEETQCLDNQVIINLGLPRVKASFTLTFNVRSWFHADMPDSQAVAEAIDQGLHNDFHSPDDGDSWWINSIVYGDGN